VPVVDLLTGSKKSTQEVVMYLIKFDLDGTLMNSSSFQNDLFSKAIQEIIKTTY